jgi:hypothetical protein
MVGGGGKTVFSDVFQAHGGPCVFIDGGFIAGVDSRDIDAALRDERIF